MGVKEVQVVIMVVVIAMTERLVEEEPQIFDWEVLNSLIAF